MSVTPNRIVEYHFTHIVRWDHPDPETSIPTTELRTRPAIVTSVRPNGRPCLHVFFEPTDDEQRIDDRDIGVIDRNFREEVEEALPVSMGGGGARPRTWSWPPRV